MMLQKRKHSMVKSLLLFHKSLHCFSIYLNLSTKAKVPLRSEQPSVTQMKLKAVELLFKVNVRQKQ